VITSQMWITFDEENEKQLSKELSPNQWIDTKLSAEQEELLLETLTKPSDQFKVTRNKHVQWCVDFVNKEIAEENEIIERILK